MRVIETAGVRIARTTVDDALRSDWSSAWREADIVQVRNPDPERRDELEAAGFIVTPGWINWVADARDSEEGFLAAMSAGARKEIRRARNFTVRNNVTITVRQGVTAEELAAFLALYQQQVNGMERGVDY